MKISKKQLIILIALALVILIPYIIFLCRKPVLIVTDMGYIPLYGKNRIRYESSKTGLFLYRRVKSVIIADDADESVIPHVISESSSRPYCVLFPFRFVRSARLYREQNPDIPIVILEGRADENSSPSLDILGGTAQDYFIYKTDINTDFYAAAMAAIILEADRTETEVEGKGRIIVFLENNIQRQGREAVLRALNTQENPPDTSFYTAFSQLVNHNNITCTIMTGVGVPFFENNPNIPVVFFTWIDSELIPDSVALVFDDSPWTQAGQAVKMAGKGVQEGVIPSKIIYRNTKKIDRSLLRKMLK